MFRTNDPFWRRSGGLAWALGQDRLETDSWKRARAGACMALTGRQIGLFMKQRQTGFMNSPG
jgi:hypothetical protein